MRGFVYETLAQLAAWCGEPGRMGGVLGGGVAAGMLLAGAAASPLHCAPMCGGFVLGQVSDRMARLPSARLSECHRLRTASLPGYHLGRLTTYTCLGFAAGGGGFAMQRLGGSAGIFLLIGAVLLVLQAARRSWPGFALPLTRRMRGFPLGVALGFLPCGILYAALAAAAATGSPLYGALAMFCFGLGTVPALVAVGLFGAAAGHRFRRGVAVLAPAVLLFNAGLLTLLGVRLLAGS
jgi:sulfite exporter TauE/SafE